MSLLDRAPREGLLSALRHRPFALLWAGDLVSRVGDALTQVALAWWVLEETGSSAAMAKVLIALTVPMLLLLLIGGVVVDRVDRLRLLLACDIVRGAVVALIAVLAAADALRFWHLLGLSVVFGAALAFTYPAFVALTRTLVPAEAITSAVSLRSLGVRGSLLVGPVVAGVIVAVGGTSVAFGLDAATFAVSGTLVTAASRSVIARRPVDGRAASAVDAPDADEPDAVRGTRDHEDVSVEVEAEGSPASGRAGTAMADLREGFATVRASPALWVTIGVAGLSIPLVNGPYQASLPLLVDDELGGGVRVFSLLTAAVAAGTIVVAVWLGQRGLRFRRRGPLMYAAWVGAAGCMAAVGLAPPVWLAVALMLGYGAGWGTVNLIWATLLQELVPQERLGRVASIDALGSLAMAPVGYAAAGYAAVRWGAAPTFLAGGLMGTAVIAAGLLHPGVRGVD